jgi:hypothetical protein
VECVFIGGSTYSLTCTTKAAWLSLVRDSDTLFDKTFSVTLIDHSLRNPYTGVKREGKLARPTLVESGWVYFCRALDCSCKGTGLMAAFASPRRPFRGRIEE